MKKNIFILNLFLLVFILSACASNNNTLTPEPNDNIIVIPNISSESLELGEISNETVENLIINNDNNNNMINDDKQAVTSFLSPDKQPNLIKEYSQAIIKTNLGDIKVKLYNNEAPVTANNFLYLAQNGFYNGTKFHRVIKNFMIQGGDPLSREGDARYWGTGGPDYRFQDEINNHKLVLGSLAMANSGPNTNGSQFFIVSVPETPWLDGLHTNFGQVIAGAEVVKNIEALETGINDRPLEDVVINSIELIK